MEKVIRWLFFGTRERGTRILIPKSNLLDMLHGKYLDKNKNHLG